MNTTTTEEYIILAATSFNIPLISCKTIFKEQKIGEGAFEEIASVVLAKDSGCSDLNSMSSNNLNYLNLKIKRPYSNRKAVIANDDKVVLLDEIDSFIKFQDIKIPITFRVREGEENEELYDENEDLNVKNNTQHKIIN
ncbi:7269_t:CDS:2 [Gigaspora margarita]|uniref:7269_t:CDS:1 n=1 Tax=Gigaspora margarita TaxID=4874 RepID=A0ABN7WDR0_GIGMA|nr:7269_t:CDS:2 [Gigaspora margarita]